MDTYYVNAHNNWLYVFILLIMVLSALWIYKHFFYKRKEGFSQKSPFIAKQDSQVYDNFYIEHYDQLFSTQSYSNQDILSIVNLTHPNSNSVFLDIGCGSGKLLRELENKDFNAFGIDKSRYMVEQCNDLLQHSEVQCDDVLRDPMLYENGSFSHILCTHYTIYEIEDKNKFFSQCFHWLRGGGYLVVHIVDPDSFNMVVPSSDMYTHAKLSDTKITNTKIEFPDYTYLNQYKIQDKKWMQVETFTDMHGEHTRKNEKTIFMESKRDILATAMKTGFIMHGETTYKNDIEDMHQYLVVMVKPMCGTE